MITSNVPDVEGEFRFWSFKGHFPRLRMDLGEGLMIPRPWRNVTAAAAANGANAFVTSPIFERGHECVFGSSSQSSPLCLSVSLSVCPSPPSLLIQSRKFASISSHDSRGSWWLFPLSPTEDFFSCYILVHCLSDIGLYSTYQSHSHSWWVKESDKIAVMKYHFE